MHVKGSEEMTMANDTRCSRQSRNCIQTELAQHVTGAYLQ